MNPNTSMRNLLGGLLGGMAGFLIAWYVDSALLPLGVLGGVVVGWWYGEMFQVLREAHGNARRATGDVVQKTGEAIMYLGRLCGLPLAAVRFMRWIVARAIVGSVAWLVSVPGRIYRWSRAHPMNIPTATAVTFSAAWIIVGAPVGFVLGNAFFHFHDNSQGIAFGLLGLVITMGGSAFGAFPYGDSDQGRLRQYYHDWEIVSRYGYVAYVAYLFAIYTRYTVGFAVFATVALAWGAPLALILFLGIYPTTLLLSILERIGKLVQRSGHWMCFGITLAVTSCSWLYFRGQFASDVAVWSVALLTGVASGAATELLRRPLLVFYADTAFGRWIVSPVQDRVMGKAFDCGYELERQDGYVGFSTWLAAFWLGQSKVARLLRAACLGYPVARPVAII